MAGMKGRSGGSRPNTGGKREGAGRKKRPPTVWPINQGQAIMETKLEPVIETSDPLKLLLDIAFGRVVASSDQVRAAGLACQYIHTKKGEGGKKEAKQEKANGVVKRFAPAAPPLTVVSGGRS